MPAFVLSLHDRLLREYSPAHGMLVGRSRHCDLVVQDAAVPSKAFVVEEGPDGFQLRDASAPSRVLPFTPGDELRLGAHRLLCVAEAASEDQTQGLRPRRDNATFSLVVGTGKRARRVVLRSAPTRIGSGSDCAVRIDDRTVSAQHCELEACGDSVVVRDLGSRNGTWVDGRRVLSALEVSAGFQLRVGKTELSVVPRGRCEDPDRMVVESEPMLQVMADARRFAALPYPALVLGESGVGKEGIARALHELGPRASMPFVAVNAAALSPSLVESELFGHVKGAFTGASSTRRGAFALADGGTLFLDEIGELPLTLQTRLLRVLETWRVRPVGADEERPVDVRLVGATNRDPVAMVEQGKLRRDLFHRLGRLVLRVPPLRERHADIAPLAELFLAQFGEVGGARRFGPGAIACLEASDFPGNVRELRNVVQTAAALANDVVDDDAVRRALDSMRQTPDPSDEALVTVLHRYAGNASAAARALGLPRTTFRDRVRKVVDDAA